MNDLLSAFLLTFAGLFPIVNPIESAPLFFGMTASFTSAERNVLARKVAVNGFALLLGSMVIGPYLLEFFGIRLPVVRIAGGFVVTALGWKLLTQEDWSDHADSDLPARSRRKIGSFLPAHHAPHGRSGLDVGRNHHRQSQAPRLPAPDRDRLACGGALLGIIAIAITIYLAYRFAAAMAKFLGDTGLEVLVRLSAFILMCIGIEIIWSGYSALTGLH